MRYCYSSSLGNLQHTKPILEEKKGDLSFHLKKLEKGQIKPKVSKSKATMKVRTEINEIESKKKERKKEN